jgi:hypothetical protein
VGYIFAFGLMLVGYTLIDWGQYAVRGKNVSMWYLLSGRDSTSTSSDTNVTGITSGTTSGGGSSGGGPLGGGKS